MSGVQQTANSKIVDDLLQLVGLDVGDMEGLIAPSSPSTNEDTFRLQREKLLGAYEGKYDSMPEGATAAQQATLRDLQFDFTTLSGRSMTEPAHLSLAFDKVVAAHNGIRNDAAKSELLRTRLLSRLETALPPGDRPHVAPGVQPGEAEPLLREHARLTKALTRAKGEPGLALEVLQAAVTDTDAFVSKVETVRLEAQQREEVRERLTRELAEAIAPMVTDPELLVPGATAADVLPLIEARDRIALVLANPAASLDQLNEQSDQVGALTVARGLVVDGVAARAKEMTRIVQAATAAQQELLPEADAVPVEEWAEKVMEASRTAPLDQDALDKAAKALKDLQESVTTENESAQERASRRDGLRKQVQALRTLMKQTCGPYDTSEVKSTLDDIESALNEELPTIDFDGNESGEPLEEQLQTARNDLDKVVKNVVAQGKNRKAPAPTGYILRAAAEAVAEGARLQPFAGQFLSGLEELPDQHSELKEKIGLDEAPPEPDSSSGSGKAQKGRSKSAPKKEAPVSKGPSVEALTEAMKILTAMRKAVDDARGEAGTVIQQLTDRRDVLLARVEVEDPDGLPPGFGDILDQRREAVRELLGEEMSSDVTTEVIKQASRLTDVFERDLAQAVELAEEWDAKAFTTLRKEARKPLLPLLDEAQAAVLTAGTVTAENSDIKAAVGLAQALSALLEQVRQESSKAGAAKQAIGVAATGGDALDQETTDLLYDLVGPTALTDPGLKPAALKMLCACFKKANPTERAGLRDVVTEAFNGDGKLLAGLARSNDADSILELARGFGGTTNKADRKRLSALVAKGGLGGASTVLDDMLGYGVGSAGNPGAQRTKNVTQLKSLGTAFGDEDGPARLNGLVTDCGLGTARAGDPPRPGILAETLQGSGGAGLDGDATALRKLADGYSGDTPADVTSRERLKGLVEGGGFGARPRAFAPLLKRLSDSGGGPGAAPKLKEIGAMFQGGPDRAKLKTLLESGGMSGDTGEQRQDGTSRQHEHGDTLAKVFTDGLGGRPDRLKAFTSAFGDTAGHAKECADMLDAWNEFPDTSKNARQPGRKIALLLNGRHFNGNVAKLQTQFTTQLSGVADKEQRKKATRFAPSFDQRYAPDEQPDLDGTDANTAVMGYLLGRHSPTHAREGYRGNGKPWLAGSNSYWPVDTTPREVADMIGEAMQSVNAPKLGKTASITLANGLTIEIAVGSAGAIVHAFPTGGPAPPDPGEIAKFSKAESQLIFNAVRP